MSEDLRISITKLATDGLNWVTYRDRMIWAFSSRRWSDHLTTSILPVNYILAGNINGQTPQDRWDAEEAAAKQLIASSIPDHVFNRIKSKTTAMEVWDTLKSLYQTRSKMIVVDLGKKLQGTRCSEEDDVRAHFTKLNDLREQLSAMGKDVDDDEYSSILLGSLPPSFESTISAINAASDLSGTDITPDTVTRLASDEYDRRVIKKGTGKNGPEEAFSADGRKKNQSNIKCYNCHHKGHYKSECWAKGRDKEGQHQENDF